MKNNPGHLDHPARILIVDDAKRNRDLIEVMLSREGYSLQSVGSGEEALAAVAAERPDLILLDVRMAGLDGYQVTRNVKGNSATKSIPIIMVTDLSDRASRLQGLEAGAEDFVSKPVDRAELCARVRNLLRLKAYGDYHERYTGILEDEVGKTTAGLVESERRLRALLDNVELVSVIMDTEGRITYCNDYLLRLIDRDRAEVVGANAFELLIPSESHERMRQVAEDLQKGGLEGQHIRFEILTRSGERRLIQWSNTVLRSGEGAVSHIAGIGEDVTEREKSVNALAQSEERFRQVTENIDEVFFLSNPRLTTMLYISPAFESIFGCTCESMYADPRSWLHLIHTEDRARIIGAVAPHGRLVPFDIQFRIVRPEGQERTIHMRGFPIRNAAGRAFRFAGVAEDITEKKGLEDQFRRAQKMEAFGQLAGGVAHDFNNLLTVILGQVAILEMYGLGEEESSSLTSIKKAGNRAADLTRQLLLFGRQQIAQMTTLDLNAAITETAKMLARIVGDNVQLDFRPTAKNLFVHADAGMLDQVLMNLTVNARDAMPNGGSILIETMAMELNEEDAAQVREARAGSFVSLSVTDTGTGITPDVLLRIFEPFFTTKDIGKGTGLGLATVYGIVKEHEGWMAVESEPGVGTTFRAFLPSSGAEAASSIEAEPDSLAGGSEAILVVEDEVAVKEMVAAYLESLGYHVHTAGNPTDAIEVFAANKETIALLLTDIMMPGGSNGKELAAILLAAKETLQIIYTSGSRDLPADTDVLLVPGKNFARKPFTLPKIAQMVRRKLDSQRSAALTVGQGTRP